MPEKSAGGFVYVTGGVSAEELQDLAMQKQKNLLWITTAARSGAYLSDARLRILDPKKQAVLDTMIIGPWLMVDLPVDVYTVEAKFNGQTLARTTRIHPGDHHQVVLYFHGGAQRVAAEPATAAAPTAAAGRAQRGGAGRGGLLAAANSRDVANRRDTCDDGTQRRRRSLRDEGTD
ncbi:MAG TPA: hypothetical protein VFR86_04310 [Burkholderiaceae bacterium]|nr:hypothetical protein [Burkholderiaceae bacterium]